METEREKAIFRDCFSHEEEERRDCEKQEGGKKVKYSGKITNVLCNRIIIGLKVTFSSFLHKINQTILKPDKVQGPLRRRHRMDLAQSRRRLER